MTKITLDNNDITDKIDLNLPLAVFKALTRKNMLRQGRRVARLTADGRENTFENGRLNEYATIEVTTRPRYVRRLKEATAITLDGQPVTEAVSPKMLISTLVAMLDRRLYSANRRLSRMIADGMVREQLSDMDPIGRYAQIGFESQPLDTIRKAVVSLCIGERFDKIRRTTFPRMQRYAEAVGADFIPITEPKLFLCTPHCEMYQVFDLWDRYERILFLDADVVVRRNAGDIFGEVPDDRIGLFNEGHHVWNLFEERHAVRQCGMIEWPRGFYYNSGVVVSSYLYRDIYEYPEEDEIVCSCVDQTIINYRIMKHRYPVHELPPRFNFMSYCGNDVSGADFIHFAGCAFFMCDPQGRRLGKHDQMLQVIDRDENGT